MCPSCQIHDLQNFSIYPDAVEHALLKLKRIKRFTKRRYLYLRNVMYEIGTGAVGRKANDTAWSDTSLQPGDWVRVRSGEEIRSSLDRWNQLHRCSFMEEMWRYCGTTQRIFKKVERFLDERDYLVKKCSGIYLLDGVFCNGTRDFGGCDRSCFFFWRREWLEKIRAA